MRLTLLGVGAMNSPRFGPAGLLVTHAGRRVVLDGGPGAAPDGPLDAWAVSDEQAELHTTLRRIGAAYGRTPAALTYQRSGLRVEPLPVRHTSHPTFGYRVRAGSRVVVWAPEFWEFPDWAAGADVLFADAAGWDRPIRFPGGVGGHAHVHRVAGDAQRHDVRRLVFAHVGRPSIRAMDAGKEPPFGEWGVEGRTYRP